MSKQLKPSFVVPGFRAAGIHAGVKPKGLDLALIASDVPAATAGVFSKTSVPGAPLLVSRSRAKAGWTRGVVVNSGCSNVALGERGVRDAQTMADLAAKAIGCESEQMLVASTGVIGVPLPMPALKKGIPIAAAKLNTEGFSEAAEAILTTDTVTKIAHRSLRVGGRRVTLAGIAKGSGMIEPNMATMLSFLVTDAAISPNYLRRLLRHASNESFNLVSVDGEGSTSDMALLFANGLAGNSSLKGPQSAGAEVFASALGSLCQELAQAIARDGEGATKLITVEVSGAYSPAQATRAARRIANSLLVKTAVFGGDPNWGRILQTVGAAELRLDLEKAEVQIGGIAVFREGKACGRSSVKRAESKLKADEVVISIDLGVGRAEARVWTCDLSYDYVKINAEYTT